MPELPEVETVRRALERAMVGRVVTKVTIHRRDVVVFPGDPKGGFARNTRTDKTPPTPVRARPALLLRGATVGAVRRHGKTLVIAAERDDRGGQSPAAVVHLGMSGQLLTLPARAVAGGGAADVSHGHVEWTLADPEGGPDGGAAGRVLFRDPRRFGGVWGFASLADAERAMIEPLGPDALGVTAEELGQVTRGSGRGSGRAIKVLLLDQRALAGVGNIYAAEALFRAGLRPDRAAGSVSDAEVEGLAGAIREVLADAIERKGSTLRDYRVPDGSKGGAQLVHRVYGRGGRECLVCGAVLETGVVGQRTTVWCGVCQR